jgi:hypothetical protein
MGSANNSDRFFVDDQEQVKLTVNTYKMLHVFNKDHIFYNRKSLVRAKKVGPQISRRTCSYILNFLLLLFRATRQ